MEKKKIIVSITSYPGRISNVGYSIYLLLTHQTLPPDEIHLWLSSSQFPNKTNDLPTDLITVLKHPKVDLHWLDKNTYVHKRHEIFKYTDQNDCVFLIDDDVQYADDLIEHVMTIHNQYPNCIVCYNRYSPHKYDGRHIIYENSSFGAGPHVNKVRWCGQSMIPSNLYPKYILADDYQRVRDNTSPVSDECWFQPWIVYNNIPIYQLNYDWGRDIDPKNGKNTGLVGWSHSKDENGYEKRDNWLYSVLCAYPQLMQKYKLEFNYGE